MELKSFVKIVIYTFGKYYLKERVLLNTRLLAIYAHTILQRIQLNEVLKLWTMTEFIIPLRN